MKFNVVYNKNIENSSQILTQIEVLLSKYKLEYKILELSSLETFGDFTFVIGGDGTILRAARFYSETKTPVLGINLGRLGFLSQANCNKTEELLNSILEKNYLIEERIMLESSEKLALNDFVIKGCTPSRTSKFYLEINGKEVCDYIADGLIISTPTGSTAYGLSAGGPVVYPTMDAIIIVPICPHTLNARPLVVPSSENITIRTADKLLSVSIDGYETENCVDKITIKTSSKKAYLAFLKDERFYSVLRNKLHWGIAPSRF